MSCRTTPAGSAFTTFARLNAPHPVSDVSTLSAFHALRRDYQESSLSRTLDERDPSRISLQYQALLARMRRQVQSATDLSDARRASLLARLDAAANAPVPDGGTVHALQNIVSRMRYQATALDGFLSEYARQTGVTREEALARWNELENGIDRSRSASDPDTITEDVRYAARTAGLSTEAGSLHAYAVMSADGQRIERERLGDVPRRVIRTPLAVPAEVTMQTGGVESTVRVLDAGFDPRNGYAEFSVEDVATGTQTVYHVRTASASEIDRLMDPNAAPTLRERTVRGLLASYRHVPANEVVRASAAPRCAVCGQFANAAHSCPASLGTVTAFHLGARYTDGAVPMSGQEVAYEYTDANGNTRTSTHRVDLPQVAPLRAAAREGSILLTGVTAYMYVDEGGVVRGDVGVLRREDGTLDFDVASLTCQCNTYRDTGTCRHIDAYTAAIRRRLNPPARTPASALTEAQRAERAAAAAARAQAAALIDWANNEQTLAAARAAHAANTEVSYTDDFDAFEQALTEAQAASAAKNGAAAVPFMRENALGGMAQRGSGQAFGMEIEYEFPDTMTYSEMREANERIGRALLAANLTDSAEQRNYHAAANAGFRDTHVDPVTGLGTWSWERDGSVNGGELVTPGMYDEPETWDKLEQAVRILRENGAVPTRKAGAHVHVGTGMYAGDPVKYANLYTLMTAHEDVLYRLAQDPSRGEHRQGNYSAALPAAPTEGWRDLGAVRRWQGGRTRALNLTHVAVPRAGEDPAVFAAASAKDHPEFRIFDSTLDVGVMQAQIKLSVAMTHAAARAGSERLDLPKEPIGAHVARTARRRRQPTREDLRAETASFRSLLDTLFTRKADKDQLVSLFAATKWNVADRTNRRSATEALAAAQARIAATATPAA